LFELSKFLGRQIYYKLDLFSFSALKDSSTAGVFIFFTYRKSPLPRGLSFLCSPTNLQEQMRSPGTRAVGGGMKEAGFGSFCHKFAGANLDRL
jgi:hypothetical protein